MYHRNPTHRSLLALFALLIGVLLQIGPLRTVRLYSARITDWLAAAPEWL